MREMDIYKRSLIDKERDRQRKRDLYIDGE